MATNGQEFLRRKFVHLFKCFEHSRKGFITKEDAAIHSQQLEDVIKRQMRSQGVSNEEIDKKIAGFDSDWIPSAMHYFTEMAKFAKNHADISLNEFIAFNMSIRDHIVQKDALPAWFEDSLRASYTNCWSNDEGILLEDGLELLPGVTENSKALCHQYLTDNNNRKIDVSAFISHIKNFYSNEDPDHISKYIHGYQEE